MLTEMPLTVEGTRFGTLELADEAVIEFPAGIIGLPSRRWALVAKDEESAFRWLQSIDDPAVALPVTDPLLFFPDYEVDLGTVEAERVAGEGARHGEVNADVYVTVRAGDSAEDFTANLVAPLVLKDGLGYQVLNDNPGLSTAEPLFEVVDEGTPEG